VDGIVQWCSIYVAGKTVTGATAMFTFKDPSANQRLDQAMALLTSYLGPRSARSRLAPPELRSTE